MSACTLLINTKNMNDFSKHKLAENEVIFREVNTEVADFVKDANGYGHTTELPFYCECSNTHCKKRIVLTPNIYKSFHKNQRQFIILAGHQHPEVEKIIKKKDSIYVVEKFGSMPSPDEIKTALKKQIFN